VTPGPSRAGARSPGRQAGLRSERDVVAALRAELAALDPTRPCDRVALAVGLGADGWRREPVVARLAVRLDGDASVSGRVGAGGPGTQARATTFDWSTAREHCRMAYLRGRFLARGSLSLAGGRTHLEFVVPVEEAPILARQLAEVGLPASLRVRRDRGVVTWKSVDSITTFLRRAGAGASLLELEARQVARALRGDLNRVINAESANLTRAVSAARRQLAAIAFLDAEGRLAEQPFVVRSVAEARRSTPEATLTELADRLSIHRSTVQRALERIEWLALHEDEPDASRRSHPSPVARRRSSGDRLPLA
jgi:hypothetical protein